MTFIADYINAVTGTEKDSAAEAFGYLGGIIGRLTATENIPAASLVNVWASSGAKLRLATNASVGLPADGFVLNSIASAATGPFYGPGSIITGLSGLTPGSRYYLGAAGAITATIPSAGVLQEVGVAISATRLLFNPKEDHPL